MYQAYYTAKETFRSVNALFLRSESWVSFQWLLWEDISIKTGHIQDYPVSGRKGYGYHSCKSGSENTWFLQVSTITYTSSETLRRAE